MCQRYKYSLIFVDRSNYAKYYSQITDASVIKYLKQSYLQEDGRLVIQNKENPLVMGSVTKFMSVCMASIALFNRLLEDERETATADKPQSAMLVALEKGIKNKLAEECKLINARDWRMRLTDYLPYEEEDTFMINLPEKFE